MALARIPMTAVTEHKPVRIDVAATEIGGGPVPLEDVQVAALTPGAPPTATGWVTADLDDTVVTVYLSGTAATDPGTDLVVPARAHLWIKPAAGSYRDAVPVAKVVFP